MPLSSPSPAESARRIPAPPDARLNYFDSGSLDDSRWRSTDRARRARTRTTRPTPGSRRNTAEKFMPVFMRRPATSSSRTHRRSLPGTPNVLRRQEYWSALSGAGGAVLREPLHLAVPLQVAGPPRHLGQRPVRLLARLLEQLPWFRLVPDFGTASSRRLRHLDGKSNVASNNFVAAAATPNGGLATGVSPGRRNGFRELRPIRGRCACGGSIPRTAASVWRRQHAPEHGIVRLRPAGRTAWATPTGSSCSRRAEPRGATSAGDGVVRPTSSRAPRCPRARSRRGNARTAPLAGRPRACRRELDVVVRQHAGPSRRPGEDASLDEPLRR